MKILSRLFGDKTARLAKKTCPYTAAIGHFLRTGALDPLAG